MMVILGTEYAGEMKKGVFTTISPKGPAERLWRRAPCKMAS